MRGKGVFILGAAAVLALLALTPAIFTSQYAAVPSSVPAESLLPYSSENGVSFSYPKRYSLSSRTYGAQGLQSDALVLTDSALYPSAVKNTEEPPAISMSVFPNPEGLALEKWVRSDSRSNFKLASEGGALSSGTVGGELALGYTHSGLYETDAVAIAHGGKIFLFEAGWLGAHDRIRTDFQNLVQSVHFTQ